MWVVFIERMALEFVGDFFYFPIWWYTRGARIMMARALEWIRTGNLQFAPGLWLRNIFVPMFGQYDWQGRIVSFFIRFVNIIGRTFALSLWTLVVVAGWFLWIIVPIFVVWLFVLSLV